jgi:hypothetical protein
MNKILVFILVVLLLVVSCKREIDEAKPVKEILWQKDSNYSFNSNLIQKSETFDSTLVSSMIGGVSRLTTRGKEKKLIRHYVSYNSNLSTCLSKDILARITPYGNGITIEFLYAQMPELNRTSTSVKITDLGFDIARLATTRTWGCFSTLVNGKIKFLMPVILNDGKNALLLIELKQIENERQSIQITDTKLISLIGKNQVIGSLIFCNDYFYIQHNPLLRVSTTGEVKDLLQIDFNNNFFIAGRDSVGHVDQLGNIYISINKGDNWSKYIGLPLSDWEANKVKDRLIFWDGFNLVDYDLKTLKIRPLSRKGIPHNDISSVSYLSDTIYVSTLGTGMYKKAYKDLLNEINKP